MKIAALTLTLLATTSAFVPISSPQNKLGALYSTLEETSKDISVDDDSWVLKQFLFGHPPQSEVDREHDWFSEASMNAPPSLRGLQTQAKSGSSLRATSSFAGILPDIPPVAPSLDNLKNYHLDPTSVPTKLSSIGEEKVEWFSQDCANGVKEQAEVKHNQLKAGNNEWFMELLP